MTRGTRLLLAIVIGGVLLATAAVGATAAAVYRSGTIAVEIREDDGNLIRVSLPAGLLHVAVALTPSSILEEAGDELEPLLPALNAGWQELGEAPNFVLFELSSAEENVRVEKVDSRLMIFVDLPEITVQMTVPIDTVGSLLRKLD
jgi:hypothetical protein